MILNIRFGSLYNFQCLWDKTPYLQKYIKGKGVEFTINDGADVSEIERILCSNKIKYEITIDFNKEMIDELDEN